MRYKGYNFYSEFQQYRSFLQLFSRPLDRRYQIRFYSMTAYLSKQTQHQCS